MTTPAGPVFRELPRDEAEAIIARNNVGRVAYAEGSRIEMQPIGYVYADGVINLRTSPGRKLEVLTHYPWVSFEVDEVDGPYDWRSAVATGTAYHADPGGSPHEREAYARAVEHFQRVMPEAFTEDDPVPFRNVVLRIFIHDLTGREATWRGSGASGRDP